MMGAIIRVLVFILIWCAGCALNEYYLKIESMAWVMSYGFAVGSIAHIATLSLTKGGVK
jgi:hypothetical protein